MNPFSAFFVGQIIAVYFVYGLAFFVMGVVLALASRQRSTLPILGALPLLAWFGLLHGAHEWVEMFQHIAAQSSGRTPGVGEEALRVALLIASFLCLLGFGVQALPAPRPRRRALFWGLIALWLAAYALALALWWAQPLDAVYFADVLGRYIFAIPGALLAAWGLMVQQRTLRERDLPLFGRDLVSAATALILYGGLGQLFVRPTAIPPSTVLNSDLFLAWFGVPVQLFRCVMAALFLLFMVRALRVFEEEARRRLDDAARAEREAQAQALVLERSAGRERELLNQELAAKAKELALLLDLSNLLAVPMELSPRLATVLQRVVQNLAFSDAGLIVCGDPQCSDNPEAEPPETVQIEAQTGFATPGAPGALTLDECLALGQSSHESGRATCRHADGAVIEFNISAVLLGEECWSYQSPTVALALPLLARRRPIGAVVFARTQHAGRPLALEELHLMVGIARQFELSMENARLYRQAQAREQTLGHLLAQVVEAQEAERQRIARDLHDSTGQALTAIALGLRGLANSLTGGAPAADAQRQAESIQLFATDALGELRRIITDLRPSQLDELGLAPALRWYIQNYRKRWPQIDLTFTVAGDQTRLPPHYDTVIFRVVQEALTNIAKHAHADKARVVLEMKPAEVVVTVQDNGRGFDPAQALRQPRPPGQAAAWGLLGIRERTALLGGRYEIKSAPGHGTLIRISVPAGPALQPAPPPTAMDDGA